MYTLNTLIIANLTSSLCLHVDAQNINVVPLLSCAAGEAVFVPRHDGPAHSSSEDDGFLVCYVHDESTHRTQLHMYDAKTMAAAPLAAVNMPQRVPYGFHGLWVTNDQIKSQAQ